MATASGAMTGARLHVGQRGRAGGVQVALQELRIGELDLRE
jgi:hypothetical protein